MKSKVYQMLISFCCVYFSQGPAFCSDLVRIEEQARSSKAAGVLLLITAVMELWILKLMRSSFILASILPVWHRAVLVCCKWFVLKNHRAFPRWCFISSVVAELPPTVESEAGGRSRAGMAASGFTSHLACPWLYCLWMFWKLVNLILILYNYQSCLTDLFSSYSRYYLKLNPDPCKPLAFLLIPAIAILGNTHTVSVKSRYSGFSYVFIYCGPLSFQSSKHPVYLYLIRLF